MTDASRLLEQAAELRRRSLTAEQRERRRLVDLRNARIQERGVKAVDGVVFGKGKKEKAS